MKIFTAFIFCLVANVVFADALITSEQSVINTCQAKAAKAVERTQYVTSMQWAKDQTTNVVAAGYLKTVLTPFQFRLRREKREAAALEKILLGLADKSEKKLIANAVRKTAKKEESVELKLTDEEIATAIKSLSDSHELCDHTKNEELLGRNLYDADSKFVENTLAVTAKILSK